MGIVSGTCQIPRFSFTIGGMNSPFTIQKISDGFGYGNVDSAIAVTGEDADLLKKLDSVVHQSPLVVPLSVDKAGNTVRDDGCGDGRVVAQLYPHEHRPKVFGGGLTMTVSTLVGLQKADVGPSKLFTEAIMQLNTHGIDFGAHTDDQAQAPNSGCGAIDKFPQILVAAVTYRQQIAESIASLGVATDGLEAVQDHFTAYSERFGNDVYGGIEVMAKVAAEGKLIKELADEHIEKAVILNTVSGYTINQLLLHDQMDGRADVFAVDVWRMQELADKLYDKPQERSTAFLSELVYSLATAAVLTRGNLPVYIVSKN